MNRPTDRIPNLALFGMFSQVKQQIYCFFSPSLYNKNIAVYGVSKICPEGGDV